MVRKRNSSCMARQGLPQDDSVYAIAISPILNTTTIYTEKRCITEPSLLTFSVMIKGTASYSVFFKYISTKTRCSKVNLGAIVSWGNFAAKPIKKKSASINQGGEEKRDGERKRRRRRERRRLTKMKMFLQEYNVSDELGKCGDRREGVLGNRSNRRAFRYWWLLQSVSHVFAFYLLSHICLHWNACLVDIRRHRLNKRLCFYKLYSSNCSSLQRLVSDKLGAAFFKKIRVKAGELAFFFFSFICWPGSV